MSYIAHYVDDGKGVHKIGSGVVTGAEIFVSALQESINQEQTQKLRYALIDFSDVTEMRLTPDDIRRIVEINRKTALYTPGASVAIVAPDQMSYAFSRMWHALSDDLGWKRNVFHTRPDAIAWLKKQLLVQDGPEGANATEFPSLHF